MKDQGDTAQHSKATTSHSLSSVNDGASSSTAFTSIELEPLPNEKDDHRITYTEKNSYINYYYYSTLQGLSKRIRERARPVRFVLWRLIFILSLVGFIYHLYSMLDVVITAPTSTSFDYQAQDELILPRIHICQPSTRMVNWTLAKSISRDYYFALELSIGLYTEQQALLYRQQGLTFVVNRTVDEQLAKDLINGSATATYRRFHETYGKKCEDIIFDCYSMHNQKLNCCALFEPVFTLQGMCWVSKKDAIKVRGSSSFAMFHFHLNHNTSEDTRPYFVALADNLDQTDFVVEQELVHAGQLASWKLTQKKRTSTYTFKSCYDDSDEKLKYFREFSSAHCDWERIMLRNLNRKLNETCDLPLVELLNPNYTSPKVCNSSQLRTLLKAESFTSTQPITLEKIFVNLQQDKKLVEDAACLSSCQSTNHEFRSNIYAEQKNHGSFPIGDSESLVVLQYTTKEVETMKQEPRQKIVEQVFIILIVTAMWIFWLSAVYRRKCDLENCECLCMGM